MNFVVLKFIESGLIEAVPSNWVNGDICSWPKTMSPSMVSKCIKESTKPGALWEKYDIKIYYSYGEWSFLKYPKLLNLTFLIFF